MCSVCAASALDPWRSPHLSCCVSTPPGRLRKWCTASIFVVHLSKTSRYLGLFQRKFFTVGHLPASLPPLCTSTYVCGATFFSSKPKLCSIFKSISSHCRVVTARFKEADIDPDSLFRMRGWSLCRVRFGAPLWLRCSYSLADGAWLMLRGVTVWDAIDFPTSPCESIPCFLPPTNLLHWSNSLIPQPCRRTQQDVRHDRTVRWVSRATLPSNPKTGIKKEKWQNTEHITPV